MFRKVGCGPNAISLPSGDQSGLLRNACKLASPAAPDSPLSMGISRLLPAAKSRIALDDGEAPAARKKSKRVAAAEYDFRRLVKDGPAYQAKLNVLDSIQQIKAQLC